MHPETLSDIQRVRKLARLIRILDDEPVRAPEVLKTYYPKTGRAWVIGITGPAGVGKSSLVNQLIKAYRQKGKKIGVIAIDPTSPFSGGALLGDRVRMQDHEGDPGVFVRSLATRGQMGGLSRSTFDIIDLMDASGMDIIFVETVGVGQDEVDIARAVHTVILVLVPGLGDEIQALKAGIMEIADIFVINKKDREGAERMRQQLRHILELVHETDHIPKILLTQAQKGEGIDELVQTLDNHYTFLKSTSEWEKRRQQYVQTRVFEAVRSLLTNRVETGFKHEDAQDLVQKVIQGELDPYTAARLFLKHHIFQSP